MFVSGIMANISGIIYSEPRQTNANDSKVTSVIIAQQCGYGDKRHTVYIECSFWGKDSDSLLKYGPNHPMTVSGMIDAVPYMDEKGNPQVRLKINPVVTWCSNVRIQQDNEQGNIPVQKNNVAEKTPERPSPQRTSNNNNVDDKLKKALDYVLKSGQYAGYSVSAILEFDPQYVYDIAANNDYNNQGMKAIFANAYNWWYSKTHSTANGKSKDASNKESNSGNVMQGVKRNHVPNYSSDTPDEDLPF